LATGNQRAILIQTKPDPNPNPQKTKKKKKQKKEPRHRSIPSQRHMHNGIYQNISTPKQKILLDSPDAN
jgi:hypothetical protein